MFKKLLCYQRTYVKMYTPSAPKFELNAGTARWMLHYLNNPPPQPEPMDVEFPEPPPITCTDMSVHQEWLDKICAPPLVRQNALSKRDWYILLNS